MPESKASVQDTLSGNDEISSMRTIAVQATKRLRRIEEHAKTCDCCREVLEEQK